MSSERSIDRRVRRTRRLLQQALLQLLCDEPLENITVTQITARADVSRQAFYLHFASKEELLLSHVDDVSAQVRAAVLARARGQGIGMRELLTAVFTEWAAHADALRVALQIKDKDTLIERIRPLVADLMGIFAVYNIENAAVQPPTDYAADFFTGGLYMLLRSWNRDGLATPPADMAELSARLIGYGIPPGRAPGLVRRQPL